MNLAPEENHGESLEHDTVPLPLLFVQELDWLNIF